MVAPEPTTPNLDPPVVWRSLARPQREPHPPWRPLRLAPVDERRVAAAWEPLTWLRKSPTLGGHGAR